jgi:aconitate hydratase
MYSLSASSALWPARRLARAGMATAAQRIGEIKVAMSLLEKDSYINYQRIEDNLAVVRQRYKQLAVFVK